MSIFIKSPDLIVALESTWLGLHILWLIGHFWHTFHSSSGKGLSRSGYLDGLSKGRQLADSVIQADSTRGGQIKSHEQLWSQWGHSLMAFPLCSASHFQTASKDINSPATSHPHDSSRQRDRWNNTGCGIRIRLEINIGKGWMGTGTIYHICPGELEDMLSWNLVCESWVLSLYQSPQNLSQYLLSRMKMKFPCDSYPEFPNSETAWTPRKKMETT